MDSLRFGSWKDFRLGWWNALAWFPASAILKVWHCGSNFVLVYAIMHEKSRTEIRESWPSCPWQYFRSLIAGSLSYLYSWLPTALFYLHQGTSLIGSCWHVSRGGRPLACHFANTSVEMAKFVRSALKTLFYKPWIQATLFLIIAIAAASAAVSWEVCWVDFADSTSADHFDFNRLYSTAVYKVWCLQCGQMF